MAQHFVDVAEDPRRIPGIFNYCDQWCAYCPLTARCLAFACIAHRREREPGDIYQAVAGRLHDAVQSARDQVATDGGDTRELDSLLRLTDALTIGAPVLRDPIERMGRQYFLTAAHYLTSRADLPELTNRRESGVPTPLDVLAWYHKLVPVKIYRALVAEAQAARGDGERLDDANVSAKIALMAIDRSILALGELADEDADARIDHLRLQLRRLARELDGRFPSARGLVRPHVDAPAD
jgi:hypothetical protein